MGLCTRRTGPPTTRTTRREQWTTLYVNNRLQSIVNHRLNPLGFFWHHCDWCHRLFLQLWCTIYPEQLRAPRYLALAKIVLASITMRIKIIDGVEQSIEATMGSSEELVIGREDLIPLAISLLEAWRGQSAEELSELVDLAAGSVSNSQEV